MRVNDRVTVDSSLTSSLSLQCFVCITCDKKYKTEGHYKRHLQHAHPVTAEQALLDASSASASSASAAAANSILQSDPISAMLDVTVASALEPTQLKRELSMPKYQCVQCKPIIAMFDEQGELW